MEPVEQKSESETCPTCGTIKITFDPPLYFEAEEACGKKDVIIIARRINGVSVLVKEVDVRCVEIIGHGNRPHRYLIEELIHYV